MTSIDALIGPEDPRWSAALDRVPHDFYHLPGYVALEAARQGGEPLAYVRSTAGATLVQPLVRRALPAGARGWDATTPYGYPGPAASGPLDARRAALASMRDTLGREGATSVFVRMHPLFDEWAADGVGVGAVVTHGETVWVDLRRSEGELWRQTRKGHRTEIQRARRLGHVVREGVTPDSLLAFGRLYRATMARLSAAPEYFFDDEYLGRLADALGGRLRLLSVEIDGALAAAGMFVVTQDLCQYHLSGSDERFRALQPTKLMIDHARSMAREAGCTQLHLGGGLGARRDSLFDFKTGFSDGRATFRTLRLVVDAARFEALCATVGRRADDPFFPAYRAPAVTGSVALARAGEEAR